MPRVANLFPIDSRSLMSLGQDLAPIVLESSERHPCQRCYSGIVGHPQILWSSLLAPRSAQNDGTPLQHAPIAQLRRLRSSQNSDNLKISGKAPTWIGTVKLNSQGKRSERPTTGPGVRCPSALLGSPQKGSKRPSLPPQKQAVPPRGIEPSYPGPFWTLGGGRGELDQGPRTWLPS